MNRCARLSFQKTNQIFLSTIKVQPCSCSICRIRKDGILHLLSRVSSPYVTIKSPCYFIFRATLFTTKMTTMSHDTSCFIECGNCLYLSSMCCICVHSQLYMLFMYCVYVHLYIMSCSPLFKVCCICKGK